MAIRTKVFSTKFGGVASYGSTNEQNVSFLLRKFPAICYIYGTHLFTVFYSLCARPVVTNQHVHHISM